MLHTNGKTCTVCGCNQLNFIRAEKEILEIDERVFEIKNFPAYLCLDCEEVQIKLDTKNMIEQMLLSGIYEAVEETTIPVYSYSLEKGKENYKNNGDCSYCSSALDSGLTNRIYSGKDMTYCVERIPSIFCSHCKYEPIITREAREELEELRRDIERKLLLSTSMQSYIVVKA